MQLFVLPREGGGEASLTVTRDFETPAESLEKYVDVQLKEASQKLNRFQFLSRRSFTLGGQPAEEIDYLWTLPEQTELRQKQAYAGAPGKILIFTLTTRPQDGERHAANWRQVLESVKLRPVD